MTEQNKSDSVYVRPSDAPPYHPRRDRILIKRNAHPDDKPETEKEKRRIILLDKGELQVRAGEEEKAKEEAKKKPIIHTWEVVDVGEGTMTQSGLIPNVSVPGANVVLAGYPVEAAQMFTDMQYDGYALVQDSQILMDVISSEDCDKSSCEDGACGACPSES